MVSLQKKKYCFSAECPGMIAFISRGMKNHHVEADMEPGTYDLFDKIFLQILVKARIRTFIYCRLYGEYCSVILIPNLARPDNTGVEIGRI